MPGKLDAQHCSHLPLAAPGNQCLAQHHQAHFHLSYLPGRRVLVTHDGVAGLRVLADDTRPAPDVGHLVLLPGPGDVLLEPLSAGPQVGVEDIGSQLRVVLVGQDGLLGGEHAAHAGAVGVVVHVPRADALDEGDCVRVHAVRGTQ
jgi:hypothetical protein